MPSGPSSIFVTTSTALTLSPVPLKMSRHVTAHAHQQSQSTLTPLVVIVLFLFFPKPAVEAQANNDACPVLRPHPVLYNATEPFATDFTNKTQALTFLHENYGRVNTNKVLACRRTDHLLYNTSLGGAGLSTDARGLRIVQDNIGGSVCDRNSEIATGHLLTRFYIEEGRIDLTARMDQRQGRGTRPRTAFRALACISTTLSLNMAIVTKLQCVSPPVTLPLCAWVCGMVRLLTGRKRSR